MALLPFTLSVADVSSTSEDEESDTENIIFLYILLETNRFFGEKRDLMDRLTDPGFDLNSASDANYLFHFRFTKSQIVEMVNRFALPLRLPLRYRVSGFKALCILLHRFAYPIRLASCAQFWGAGHNPSQISVIVTWLSSYLFRRYNKLIYFDGESFAARMQLYVDAIARKGCPLPGACSFLDATNKSHCRPVRHQRAAFSGHKKRHVLKFQSLVTPDGLVRSFFGPMEGRRTDAWLLSKSNLFEAFSTMEAAELVFALKKIWADGGYGLNKYVFRPFINPVDGSPAHLFNVAMSRLRISVEWGFHYVNSLFKYLNFSEQLKVLLQPVGLFYNVAVLLANCKTCLHGGNQIATYFECAPPTLSEYLRHNGEPFRVTPPADS
jgi:hypothetical protein